MASIVLQNGVGGSTTIQEDAVTATNNTLTLPTVSGQLFVGTSVGGALAANQGGTGLTSVGASGNYLVSNGTTWVSQTPPVGVSSFNTRTGAVTLASSDVTGALGYTPPQANGTGASGTWAINITGNAATATTATTATGNGVPTGTLMMWPTVTPPAGYLLCNGTQVSTTTYAALYAVIGTTFGSGSGTFALPNYTNNMPIGAGGTYGLATTGGAASTTLITANVPAHTHNYSGSVSGTTSGQSNSHNHNVALPNGSGAGFQAGADYNFSINQTDNNNQDHSHSFSAGYSGTTDNGTGSGTSFTNLPPYLAIYFIIKT